MALSRTNVDTAIRHELTAKQAVFARQDPRPCPACQAVALRPIAVDTLAPIDGQWRERPSVWQCTQCWHKEASAIDFTHELTEERRIRAIERRADDEPRRSNQRPG